MEKANNSRSVFRSQRMVITTFSVLLIVAVLGMYKLNNNLHQTELDEKASSMRMLLGHFNTIIQDRITDDLQHVLFLQQLPSIQGLSRAIRNEGTDPYINVPTSFWDSQIQQIFATYVANHPSIKQIALVSWEDNGKELLKIQQNHGSITVLSPLSLRTTAHEPYFTTIKELSPGQAYFSSISLSDKNQLEQAIPSYVIAKSIYDERGDKFGFVIITVEITELINRLSLIYNNGYSVYIIGNQNQFLAHQVASHVNPSSLGKAMTPNTLFSEFDLQSANSHQLYQAYDRHQKESVNLMLTTFKTQAYPHPLKMILTQPSATLFYSINQAWKHITLAVITILALFFWLLSSYWGWRKKTALGETSEPLSHSFVQYSDDPILVITNGTITYCNAASEMLFNMDEARLLHTQFAQLFEEKEKVQQTVIKQWRDENQTASVTVNYNKSDGSRVLLSIALSPANQQKKRAHVSVAVVREMPVDITDTSRATAIEVQEHIAPPTSTPENKNRFQAQSINFDIIGLVSNLASSYYLSAKSNGLTLIVDTSDITEYRALGDPRVINSIVSTLLDNAIKQTSTGDITIKAKTYRQEKQLKLFITVNDTGRGIAQERQANLIGCDHCNPSFIEDKLQQQQLDLPCISYLCKSLGGTLSLKSELTQGCSFIIDIDVTPISEADTLASLYSLWGKSILLVEPPSPSRHILENLLAQWGANIQTESSLSDNSIDLSRFDVIIAFYAEKHSEDIAAILDPASRKLPVMFVIEAPEYRTALPSNCLTLLKPYLPYRVISSLKMLLEQEKTTPAPLDTPHEGRRLANKHILVVDDNEVNRQVAENLVQKEGAKVLHAVDGQQALDVLNTNKETHIDAILMDCQMPVMDGFKATALIRSGEAGESHKSIPIVAVTASALPTTKQQCMVVGMNDCIFKPLSSEKLMEALSRWLNIESNTQKNSDTSPLLTLTPAEEPLEAEAQTNTVGEIWDFEGTMFRMANDEYLLKKMLTLFISNSRNDIGELQVKAMEGDMQQTASLAHKLKGSASSLGATTLSACLKDLELTAKNNNKEGVTENLTLLQTSYDSYIAKVKEYCRTAEGDAAER